MAIFDAMEPISYITTLDGLIAALQELRKTYPGDTTIGLDDPDSGYHMKLTDVNASNSVPGRLLIRAAEYHDKDGYLPE